VSETEAPVSTPKNPAEAERSGTDRRLAGRASLYSVIGNGVQRGEESDGGFHGSAVTHFFGASGTALIHARLKT
jgi:hypothetical protein